MAVAAALLAGCSSTDGPEGVVERWLLSLNQGKAGEPERYAPETLSERILPEPREAGDLDVIEVGKGSISGGSARVPYRVEVLDGPNFDGVAELERTDDGWRVVALGPKDLSLSVPSEGGRRIGGAPLGFWLAGLAAAGALILLTVGLMAAFGRHPTAASAAAAQPDPD
jgi:hypothetical protein